VEHSGTVRMIDISNWLYINGGTVLCGIKSLLCCTDGEVNQALFHGDGIQVIRDTPNLSRVFHGILCNLQGPKKLRMFLNVWGTNRCSSLSVGIKGP
jgi:hypothetical protein